MNFDLPVRVYYEDTDAGGVVFYANYMRFAERGRTEVLRSLGFENKSLGDNEGIFFVVRRVEADYLAPARLDDMLTVRTVVAGVKNASFTMNQTVLRGDTVLCAMAVVVVAINREGRPVRVPDVFRQALERCLTE